MPNHTDERGLAVEAALLDIEGTVSPTGYILGDLYDYARPRLGPYVAEHRSDPAVREALSQISQLRRSGGGPDEVVEILHGWMDADEKATPLKTLQGLVWAEGFERGELHAKFFDDVVPALADWHRRGIRLAVFSSGSATSQKAWFGHSPGGDLTGLFSGYFDTVTAGPKREAASYGLIAAELSSEARRIAFLSDTPAELDAAVASGLIGVGVARPGEPNCSADFGDHQVIGSFAEIELCRVPAS